jgi:hypothetical protein
VDSKAGKGGQQLKAAVRRLAQAWPVRAKALRLRGDEPGPAEPLPVSEWGRRAEERLRAVEKQVANQNRLLLLSLVAIVADMLARVAGK